MNLAKALGIDREKGFTFNYKCKWPGCNNEFIVNNVRMVNGVSTQIICPKCKNGLKTWEDGN